MKRLIPIAIGSVCVLVALGTMFVWFTCRIYVPENMCAVLIKKTGAKPPGGGPIAFEPGQKGIQEQVLGPGRHFFYDPIRWEHRLVPLTEVPAGDPNTWEWIHSLSPYQRQQLAKGTLTFKGEFPMVGVVRRKVGDKAPGNPLIVSRDSSYKGVLREVLTPGTYKINPEVYGVELRPAVVIPAGFVGVVTNLLGDEDLKPGVTGEESASVEAAASASVPSEQAELEGLPGALSPSKVRPLASAGQRGTIRDVLQPGVYFINPKIQRVTIVEVGFNEYSQLQVGEGSTERISFPSDTGYDIRVGVTVVWGVHPRHAAEILNEYGNIDAVQDKVIRPQLRSICRVIGSTYSARDFIQGEKRELFQRDLTGELRRVCESKHVEVLLALVREIEVHAPNAGVGEVTEDLKRTIQESHIAVENQITKAKQREAAMVRAQLEEERKKIDIARETIRADARIMVANIAAEGEKEAARLSAEAELEVAGIRQKVAALDAQRIEILGKANANVQKMEKAAEAEGFRMLVGAFGSPQAYNLYTFAEGFEPESIRLFFAGDGTFWTDLTRFEEIGAAQLMQNNQNNQGKR